MKLYFAKPNVPNFIKVKNNHIETVPIESLSEDELTEYAEFWCVVLRENYARRKKGDFESTNPGLKKSICIDCSSACTTGCMRCHDCYKKNIGNSW